jgi:hypothetical protein
MTKSELEARLERAENALREVSLKLNDIRETLMSVDYRADLDSNLCPSYIIGTASTKALFARLDVNLALGRGVE